MKAQSGSRVAGKTFPLQSSKCFALGIKRRPNTLCTVDQKGC